MYFDELDLNDNVLDALYDMHFDVCTPVQEKCIPQILEGHDLLGVAQTGTGKTAAYLLPILSKLDDGGYPAGAINCVIMSPTRELAQQIDQAMQGFGYYLNGVSSVAVYGGNDGNRYDQELKSLSLGADVIIATPGRLLSHLNMGNADFSKVSFFVLDEADRMLDMGFSDDIKKIAKELPSTCQTIMFSATMPDKIEELAKTLLKNPVEIKIAVSKPAEKIRQSAFVCYENQKLGIIKDLFKKGDLQRVIIFSGKKQKVKLINRALMQMHINSGEMHSDLEQAERDQMLYKFKSGQLDVLVATDIVARGIDIDDIAMVINFDVPRDAEDYVHRIGRTARADRDGVAITFICDSEIYYFKQIEKLLEKEVEKIPLPEGLGEGPDYATTGKISEGKTSAKSRRRKDRNTTAHKHKPRGEASDHKPRQEKEQKSQKLTTETTDKGKAIDNSEQKEAAVQQRKQKENRKSKNTRSTESREQTVKERKQPSRQNKSVEQATIDSEKHPQKRRHKYRQKPHTSKQDIPTVANGPRTKDFNQTVASKGKAENGSLLKKTISWLKGLGKK